MTSIVLICSVLASLAAGVLLAYGICLGLFAMFRTHARQIGEQREVIRQAIRPAA